ncbi:hypothetical protein ABZS29_26470 [Kribbella sp. NPDC005582]|uniref:hypothetical protein n=1 Tax=Kribbella sp. NPDC005582 TaxID=3156893 RepID=UPI0033A0E921
MVFRDDFDGADLDLSVWSPYYLPQWSSRAATKATYALSDSCLTLSIPTDQPLCAPGTTNLRSGWSDWRTSRSGARRFV